MSRRPRFHLLAVAMLVMACTTSACRNVPFYEQEGFSKRVMTFDARELETELRGHIFAPREGASGGFSNAGAGGCGCY